MDLQELGESYKEARKILLDEADRRYYNPEYAYENQSGIEVPEKLRMGSETVNLRGTKLFSLMTMGSLENIKEFLDDPEIRAQYLAEIFGTEQEYRTETQRSTELEEAKEAA
jgi:hypothetical protein